MTVSIPRTKSTHRHNRQSGHRAIPHLTTPSSEASTMSPPPWKTDYFKTVQLLHCTNASPTQEFKPKQVPHKNSNQIQQEFTRIPTFNKTVPVRHLLAGERVGCRCQCPRQATRERVCDSIPVREHARAAQHSCLRTGLVRSPNTACDHPKKHPA